VRPPDHPRQLAQRLLAPGRLVGVHRPAHVLPRELQHTRELARVVRRAHVAAYNAYGQDG